MDGRTVERDGTVDVVIVGSGPIGSAFARIVLEETPSARVLLVEVGPQLTTVPGVHLKNVADEHERLTAQLRSQGASLDSAIAAASARAGMPLEQAGLVARAGTSFLDPERASESATDTMPAAAMSTNVGGMAAHWTCACPHPYGRERIAFIADREWDELVEQGRRLLAVTTEAFPRTRHGEAILRTLSAELDAELPEGRKVQRMPLACRVDADGARHWSGTDVVLGPLATDPPPSFELRAETLCRRILTDGERATGVLLRDLRTGEEYEVRAGAVVAACDSFRTPQLLWASGIRPRALGHYLNDHVQVFAGVALDEDFVARATADLAADDLPDARGAGDDPIVGVFWVPYADDAHPFHSQVMHFDMSPLQLEGGGPDEGQVVGIGALFNKADIRFEDCVTFSDAEVDAYGMPRMSIAYGLTDRDHAHIEAIRAQQDRAAAAFGSYAPGRGPRVMPPGSSLHYQGTVRMGEADDGESVCDPFARVWGFRNLYVGGNGVIPTATCGNSTLTSVAVAVRSARALAADL
jgi:C-glycoside oxidase